MTELYLDCLWLPTSHGGRQVDPQPGLRLGIRWQRYLNDTQDIYRDVQFVELSLDSLTRQGIAYVRLATEVPDDWKQKGELVEILEGYKVVAVGRVTGPSGSDSEPGG